MSEDKRLATRIYCRILQEQLPSGNKSALEGYFDDQSDDRNGNDAVWAAHFGHSVRTGAMVYGRDVKLGTSIEENICHFRRISIEWHSFLELDKDITMQHSQSHVNFFYLPRLLSLPK